MAHVQRTIASETIIQLPCRRMHLAFILPNLCGGGLQRTALRIAMGLIDRGHKVDFLLNTCDVRLAEEIPKSARVFVLDYKQTAQNANIIECLQPTPQFQQFQEVKSWIVLASIMIRHLRRYSNFRVRIARSLANYIYREQPDFLLPQLPTSHEAVTVLACYLLNRCPTIIPVIHSHMTYDHERHNVRTRLLCEMARHTITVSKGVANNISRIMGIPTGNITSIYSPVCTEKIDRLGQQKPSHSWFSSNDVPILLSVGRLVPAKDFVTLIHAFFRVRRRQDCRLIILGEGKHRPILEKLVVQLNLEQFVSMPGYVENPYSYMRRASLFVLSSKREGLPTVLIEALACGCPCVSTNCESGPSEILMEGEFGELVPVGDEIALSQAIGRALAQQPNKQRLQSRARDFSMNCAVGKYEKVLESVGRGGVV